MNNNSNVTASSQDFDESTSYTGRVKWFNNKAGYGFLTVCRSSTDEKVGDDIFVHHSGVKVASEQYKYLVQGEYVDFTLRKSDSGAHPFQAADLTGVAGGKLMCETRLEVRQAREDEDGDDRDSRQRRPRRQHNNRDGGGRDGGGRDGYRGGRGSRERVRLQGSGPREGETWKLTGSGDKGRDRRQNSKVNNDEQ